MKKATNMLFTVKDTVTPICINTAFIVSMIDLGSETTRIHTSDGIYHEVKGDFETVVKKVYGDVPPPIRASYA